MIKKTKKVVLYVLTYEWKIAKTAKTREAKHSWQLVCCATHSSVGFRYSNRFGGPFKNDKINPLRPGPCLGALPGPANTGQPERGQEDVSGFGFRGKR